MDESELMSLIAKGEHQGLEFKRELHLETKMDRGEFVKDIIAMANSAPSNRGYLLVGVADDGSIFGTEGLQEERIQEIAHRYIRPTVTLRCSIVSMQAAGLSTVGVIEIEGIERPYSCTREIGRWKQDDVFVRHGSVVKLATPGEIIRMRRESQQRTQRSILSLLTSGMLTGLLIVTLMSQLELLLNNSLPIVSHVTGIPYPREDIFLYCWACGLIAAIPYSVVWGMPVAVFGLIVSLLVRSRRRRLNLILSLLVGILNLPLLLGFLVYRAILD